MVKPLYVRVPRKHSEKLKSGEINVGANTKAEGSATTNAKSETGGELIETTTSNGKSLKQATLPAGLKVVCKHLRKSRSATSAVAAVHTATTLVFSKNKVWVIDQTRILLKTELAISVYLLKMIL